MATARISPTDPPSSAELTTERATRFHQDGNALLTVESVRTWLVQTGLALYLPRPDQLPVPAPSFVETTIGAATAEPTPNQLDGARAILARLIAEGACVPLNLLGANGASGTDTPDFVCSPAVFSFLFTLRGNKAWKTPPVTSGPVKVSPLALNTYELLAAKVTLSAYDLTTQLGKEVTEAAVLRALTELWQQLRVIPVPQTDGSHTLWELASARFTKQIKAGANAGQPTALSALISLYLNQAIAATEDEVETFLSPLAPRSRLRSVVHDLIAARQLETVVVDGKTLVHITGDLPSFTATKRAGAATDSSETELGEPGVTDAEDGSRIRKFTPNPGTKLGTGLRTRPAFDSKPSFGKKPGFGGKPAYGKAAGNRERRPFDRDARPLRPSFNKPWEEERAARTAAPATPDGIAASSDGSTERPAFRARPAFGARPAYGGRPSSGPRPAFRDTPAYRDRPARPERDAGESRPPRPGAGFGGTRPFRGKPSFPPREDSPAQSGEAPRRTFSKPGTFGRKREGGFGDSRPPRREFGAGEGRPPRREFGAGEGRPPRREFGAGEGRPPRREFGSGEGRPPRRESGTGEGRPPRRDLGSDRPAVPGGFKRPGGLSSRPERSGPGGSRGGGFSRPSSGPREGGFAPRKPFSQREGGDRPPFRGKPAFGSKPGFGTRSGSSRPDSAGTSDGGEAPRKVFRKFDAPRSPKPFGTGGKRSFSRSSGEGRPAGPGGPGSFAGKGGPFAKFADGRKPFRKPGKPSGGGSGGGRPKRPGAQG